MFYGNTIFKQKEYVLENYNLTNSPISPAYESICTEYNNRLIMYENCTNECDRVILEAQLEVLYELSIKEIWNKIKKWVTDRLLAIVKWLEKLFSEGKQTKFKSDILELLKSAKKLLGEVEEAESKEEIENCKNEFDSLNNECENKMKNMMDGINKFLDSYESNGDKENIQVHRQFRDDLVDIYNRLLEVKDKDEAHKLAQEFKDRVKQHEENINK
jgi:flagellar motility protein MotE (MotC chaperone)